MSRRFQPRRWQVLVTACALTALGASVLRSEPAVAATAAITVTLQAPASVLAGKQVGFTLTAANPSANPAAVAEYNTSFRDVLPLGASYQAGSTRPADLGDPTVIADPGTGQQTLLWLDAFDLPKGSSAGLSFSASLSLPVGSTLFNTANAYASTAPRYVPHFGATGLPVTDSRVQPASSNQSGTVVSALQVSLTEPSVEAKLLRGAHAQPTVHTLRVSNGSLAATNGVTVLDYLPASLEFLGCGQVDNGGSAEYPGAPRLSATAAVGAGCLTPASVDTVLNPPANGSVSYPAGVYTKLTWALGTLAAGQVSTISYAAAVPLRQNALFAVGGPTPASLGQSANLDNNTGASTRQVNDAAGQVSYAHASGSYTGPAVGGSAVVADTSHQVSVNDLRIHKSAGPAEFVAGGVTSYTLQLDAGEYADDSAITITDVLPNGICPLDDLANHASGAPAECAAGAGYQPTVPYQSVSQNADGTFTVVFGPVSVPANGSLTLHYSARDRTSYTGGPLAGLPTAVGDSFTNTASEQGTTTPVPATGATGNQPVHDTTSATQTTSAGSLTSQVATRATPMSCTDPATSYGTGNPAFVKGDRICFQLTVPFSAANQTRNPVLSDFLPDNTGYESASVSYPAGNTVDPAQISFDATGAAGGALSWTLGASQPDGSTAVPAGAVFQVRFSVLVLDSAAGPAPDKPGNIAKLRTMNSAGQLASLRAGVDFRVAAAPPVALTNGVASVNGSSPVNGPDTDHLPVREGDSVVFRLDASNNGSAANSNDLGLDNLQLWDVLPAGIQCAQLASITDGGNCTDPGAPGQPSFAGNASLSAVVWSGAGVTTLAAGASKSYQYTLSVPAGVSVSTVFSSTAAVRSYTAATDLPGSASYYPAADIDTTVAAGQYDAPAASDPSDIYLRNAVVSDGVVSTVSESGNAGAESSPAASTQATIGEQVSFTVTARLPAGSTVYNAGFSAPLPAGLSLVSATAGYTPDAGLPADQPLPAGVSFDPAVPSLGWPSGYDNGTGTDQLFAITVVGQLAQLAGNQNGVLRTGTATFSSATAATGGSALPARIASAGVTDVEPAPGLTETNDAGSGVAGGQLVTFTLHATNAGGRPALHDGWLADCLPAGLTFAGYAAPPAGVSTAAATTGDGSNGCPTATTRVAWNLADLPGPASLTLKYTATVDPSVAGKDSYLTVAALSGNSLAGARTSPADAGNLAGRQYSAGASSTVAVAGATAQDSVLPSAATVGDTVSYSTSAVLPAGVNFYNLSLIDQVPAGIDPNSIVAGTVSCTNTDGSGCTPASAVRLSSTAGPASSTVIGWLLGDAPYAGQTRTVTVHYTARIADVAAATAGAALTDSVHVGWDNAARTPPTSSGAGYNQLSPSVTAAVTVLEPGLAVAKTVNRPHPEPGQSFSYTVTISNRNTAGTSAAFNATVTDTVPTGVLVDPLTISGAGSISGANPSTGGGVISWALPGPIAKGTAMPALGYTATLAPSGSLTAAALVNTARITGYDSLAAGGRHYTGPSATATITPYFPKVTTTKSTPAGSTGYIGESFPWLVTVRNTGTGIGYAVAGTDTLPPNWSYDAGSALVSVAGGPATAVEPVVTSSAGVQTLSWTALGTLNAGLALTINFTATPQPGVSASPGVGIAVNHTNSATSTAQDATGATGNAAGSYTAGPGTAVAHIASADVSVTKAVGAAPVAGGTGNWTLTVRNAGPNPATGPFTVTDQLTNPLPSGIGSVTATGTGWSCGTAAPVSCQRTVAGDTLASGASFPVITLGYSVAASVLDGSTVSSTATVSARTQDPNPANSVTGTATVRAAADLAISNTLASPQLVAGAPASYTLAISNLGPSYAAGPITVTDPLPAGASFVSASGTGWSCDPIPAGAVGASLHCTLPGPVAVGAVPPALSVTVGIPSGQTGPVSHTATVSSPTTDPSPAGNAATRTDTPLLRADLVIQNRHLTSPFVAGSPADYQLDVRNAGESDAAGVRLDETLPAGLSYASASSGDPAWACSATGQQVSCGYTGSFVAGRTSSVVLTVNLAAGFTGPVSSTATVSAGTADPVPGNNSDTDNSAVSQLANLSIVLSHAGTAIAGDPLDFALAVHNSGPSDAGGPVTVTDALPAGLSFRNASGAGWSCSYQSGSRLVSCVLAAGLAAGGSAGALTLGVTLDPDAGPATIDDTASVSGGTADSNLADNASTDPVQVLAQAAISLTAALGTPAPALAGTRAELLLRASNAGPSDAIGISVTNTLPAYLSLQSYTGAGWNCAATGQTVVCTRDLLPAGGAAPELALTTLVSASTPVALPAGTATLFDDASIESSTSGTRTDPPAVAIDVLAKADLALVLTPLGAGVAQAGESLGWQLAVSNAGPSDAASPITVTDTLPAHQSYLSAAGGWDCSADAVVPPTTQQTVTCSLAQPLAAGAAAPVLSLRVQLDADAPAGSETNLAVAGSPTPGTRGSGSAAVLVGKLAALSLVMLHAGHGQVGGGVDFTLRVHNAGPSIADQLVITDPLPAGLRFVSAAGAGWACAADPDGLVSCALTGDVPAGADGPELVLSAAVSAVAYPSVTNVATAASSDPALPGTAAAVDELAVDPDARLSITETHQDELVVGGTAGYLLTVGNAGPTASPGPILLTDTLPDGLSYRDAAGPGWTCAAAGQQISCRHAGSLAVGADTVVTVRVAVTARAYPAVTSNAMVTGPGSGAVTGSSTRPVTPSIVLRLHKTLASYADGLASFELAVSNQGPNDTIAPLIVTDPLPPGLTYRSASGAGWSCAGSGTVVRCAHPAPAAVGAVAPITLVAVVSGRPGAVIRNVADVRGGGAAGASSGAASNPANLTVSVTGSGPAAGSGSVSQRLPRTGRDLLAPAELALLSLLAGLGLLLLAGHRRRTGRHHGD